MPHTPAFGLECGTLFYTLLSAQCRGHRTTFSIGNHDTAHTLMNTGFQIAGRPSMGSWITYGLGSESEDLPGFIVLTSKGGGQSQPIAARQWHSGFLPSRFQGVKFHSAGDPVSYVRNPPGVGREAQGELISTVDLAGQTP